VLCLASVKPWAQSPIPAPQQITILITLIIYFHTLIIYFVHWCATNLQIFLILPIWNFIPAKQLSSSQDLLTVSHHDGFYGFDYCRWHHIDGVIWVLLFCDSLVSLSIMALASPMSLHSSEQTTAHSMYLSFSIYPLIHQYFSGIYHLATRNNALCHKYESVYLRTCCQLFSICIQKWDG
jgi:hypothetical protein